MLICASILFTGFVCLRDVGTAPEELIEIHVCFFSCWMLPLSSVRSGRSSWVSQLFVLPILFCKRIMLLTYFARSSLRISYLLYILRKGQALQFNWLYEQGAFILSPDDTFSVDFDKVSLPQFQISSLLLGYTYNISIVITIIISYYYL